MASVVVPDAARLYIFGLFVDFTDGANPNVDPNGDPNGACLATFGANLIPKFNIVRACVFDVFDVVYVICENCVRVLYNVTFSRGL